MGETKGGVNPLFLREEELRQGMELLHLALRDLGGLADGILARHGLGRAHHRALAAIARQRSLTMTDLMQQLGVTKQSLGRVLAPLIAQGLVQQAAGNADRRQRLLSLTGAGVAVERALFEPQRLRLAGAYRSAGAEAVDGFRSVLSALTETRSRRPAK
jgi:DNA-binding MarR family transcriptional regulator